RRRRPRSRAIAPPQPRLRRISLRDRPALADTTSSGRGSSSSAAAAPDDGVLAEPKDAQEEGAECSLEGNRDQCESEDSETRVLDAVEERRERDRRADEEHDARESETVLETESPPAPLKPLVVLTEVDDGIRAREETQLDYAEAENREHRARHRHAGPVVGQVAHRAEDHEPGEPGERRETAREHEEERRAVDEHESDVAPCIAEPR